MMKISTVIITKNEERNIGTCIESVSSFSDEIIIVDDYSEDKTKEIASLYENVKFHEHKFENYIKQKNYANTLAQGDYIFSIDADEYCDEKMIEFMSNIDTSYDAYSFIRINIFFGKKIKYGLRGNEKKLRLWKKNMAKWTGKTPHEHIELKPDAKVASTDYILYHHANDTLLGLFTKSIKYAKMASYELVNKSYLQLIIAFIFNPIFKFIKDFIFKKGILDGIDGFILACISFIETWMKYFYAILNKIKKQT